MISIYGIPKGTCGVYMITCRVNGKRYIGSSVDIPSRLSTHFGRDAKKYSSKRMYADINKNGRDAFKWEVLEKCNRDQLIEREAYWYKKLKPEYNLIEPCEQPFKDKKVIRLAHDAQSTNAYHEKFLKIHRTESCRQKCREIRKSDMKPVECDNGMKFECMADAAHWVSDTTSFTGKNKVSKIKAVCDGERPTAYGHKWNYL